jgi:hypothetical protein
MFTSTVTSMVNSLMNLLRDPNFQKALIDIGPHIAHEAPHLIEDIRKDIEKWHDHSNEQDHAQLNGFILNYHDSIFSQVRQTSTPDLPVNDTIKGLEEIRRITASLDNGPLKTTLLGIISQNKV